MPARLRSALLRGLLVVVLLIGTVMGILWALQRQLIYLPDTARVPPAGEVMAGARDVTLHTEDGLELGAWFVPAAEGRAPGADGGAGCARERREPRGSGGSGPRAERAWPRGAADGLPRVRRQPGQAQRGGAGRGRLRSNRGAGGAGISARAHDLLRGVPGHRGGGRTPGAAAARGDRAAFAVHRAGRRRVTSLPVLAGAAAAARPVPGRRASVVEPGAGDRDLRGPRHDRAHGAE